VPLVATIGAVPKVNHSFVSAHTSTALFSGKQVVIVISAALTHVPEKNPDAENKATKQTYLLIDFLRITLLFHRNGLNFNFLKSKMKKQGNIAQRKSPFDAKT